VILLDGHLYGYSDGARAWTCMEMMTGKVKWTDRGVGKGTIAYADGRFYLRGEGREGTIALIEASPAGYKEHGRFDQPDRTRWQAWAHLVIAGGKLYVRDMDQLFCYDVAAPAAE
jgi:outer membrane protein assembly factor BamB